MTGTKRASGVSRASSHNGGGGRDWIWGLGLLAALASASAMFDWALGLL